MKNQLQDLCLHIVDCEHKTAPTQEVGIPLIRTTDIKNGRLLIEQANRISEDTYSIWTRRLIPEENDLILAREAPVGEVGIVPSDTKVCLGQRTVLIRPNPLKINPRFLLYYLVSPIGKNKLTSRGTGSTVEHLNVKDIRELPIESLPPLPTQQKIADILGAYDELIENNRRRIVLLENMAAGLYKEWFVRMRPHGQILPTNAETGLPEGWEVKKFTDEISVLGGGTPKTENPEYWNGDICWFTPQDLDNNYFVLDTVRKITELGLKNCSSKLYPSGTVFITARGTVGKCVIAGVPMAMSQTNYALKSRGKLHQYIVFLITLSLVEKFKQEAIGAVFDTITTNNFSRTEIVIPDQKTLIQFEEIVISIFNQIKTLQEQTGVLRRVRDRLLPRLMSGELGD